MPRRLTGPEIAADIMARIDSGEYPPSAELPSYAELAHLYSVSVATAQRVYLILKASGRVYAQPGVGHFVSSPED